MANTTIYPFCTDGQLPSSIGVINDLTTGGADKALSAEMGKELKDLIGLLEARVDDIEDGGGLFSSGKIYSVKCLSGGSFNGVPAQRISDNKKGLYDTANDVFYSLT